MNNFEQDTETGFLVCEDCGCADAEVRHFANLKCNAHPNTGYCDVSVRRELRETRTQLAHLRAEEAKEHLAEALDKADLPACLRVPEVWSQYEADGMLHAFELARHKHGVRESLFAVAAWLLRHRAKEGALQTANASSEEYDE